MALAPLTNGPNALISGITISSPAAQPASTSVTRFRGGLPPKALRAVLHYIDAHLSETISLDALSRIAGLSLCHFCRAFKQSKGVSPHRYLIQRRLERVMELIAGTDLSLTEIALALGFSDQSHCARSFRKHLGICPREYRWSTR